MELYNVSKNRSKPWKMSSYHTFIGINPQALHFKTDNLTHKTCGAFRKARAHTWLASYRIFLQTRSFPCCRQLTMVKVKSHGNTNNRNDH